MTDPTLTAASATATATADPPGGPAGTGRRPISRLLVANRGEIARRIFRTCADAGIGCVAVYSDPDADSPHVTDADLAVRLPGSAPADTYLRADAVVAAALAAGADAVHPGYGFLSENAAFARAVLDAGLSWVGPPPAAIEAMGSKTAAKALMQAAGVPVLGELDPDLITAADLPVLVKASAGGGGRGMRVVRSLAELPGQLAQARSEAAGAFGDPTVFCEPYLEHGRHIEVQVLADSAGTVWALGERECSIQRRHQKVIEETPSPLVGADLRERLCAAAVRAAEAVDYVGAGTVEFLATDDGRFFFLEMNTRLQVEHPVTECVTGLDLVAAQLRVAEGARLPARPPAGPGGHAIEARLYAEDPADGWRPGSGTLYRFDVPGVDARFEVPARPGIRLDSGVTDGAVVGIHYDPLLAKVICWAPTRAEAARRLAATLAASRIHGLVTNRDLLVGVLRHPAFLAGTADTSFLETATDLLAPAAGAAAEATGAGEAGAGEAGTPRVQALSALAAALAGAAAHRGAATVLAGLPCGWRNVASQPHRTAFQAPAGRIDVGYRLDRRGLVSGALTADGFDGVGLVTAGPAEVVLDIDGVRHPFTIARYGTGGELVCVDSPLGSVTLRRLPRFGTEPGTGHQAGSLLAPMPGVVTAILAAEGDLVDAGTDLLVLEAMKMQHPVAAPQAGRLGSIGVTVGQQVEAGTVLAVVTPSPPAEEEA